MSKIKVKNMKSCNDQTIIDTCAQVSYSVRTGEFFEEENERSFASTEEAMEYLDLLASPVIDFRSSGSNRILVPQRFLPPTDPLALRIPSSREAMKAINIDFPKGWRKQISEVVWE